MTSRKTSRSREPVQTGNLVSVVGTFGGVPCSVASYQTEKQALKAYEEAKKIHQEVKAQETSSVVRVIETVEEKTRGCKTSRSGLPRCTFKPESGTGDGYALAVVRGPTYAAPVSAMSYVAILLDGFLDVVGFHDCAQAKDVYAKIRESYASSAGFQEDKPSEEYAAFSTDRVCVARGIANVVPKGGKCLLV